VIHFHKRDANSPASVSAAAQHQGMRKIQKSCSCETLQEVYSYENAMAKRFGDRIYLTAN
jgi:hypothetical protein